MSEKDGIIATLEDAGVLPGLRWAYISATDRSLELYSEADGHDATWLGTTRFTLFRDRLDRVFSCGRYAVGVDVDAGHRHAVHEQLSDRDTSTWPGVASGTVRHADLNGSPGWAHRRWRFLLASCPYGRVDRLPWSRMSATKQLVALQIHADPEARQPMLFSPGELPGLEAAIAERELGIDTFVVAHSLDPIGGGRELVFGRPRANADGEPAWYWRHNLLDWPSVPAQRGTDERPSTAGAPIAPERERGPTGGGA